MKKECHHYALGLFIKKCLKAAGLNIIPMCKEIHIGLATYEEIKRATISA